MSTTTDTHDPERGLSAVRADLERSFDRTMIQRRKIGGGREVDYVSGSAVISRLNHATGDQGWSLHVVERWKETLDVNRFNPQTKQNELVERDCLCVMAEMTIPGLGTRTGIGVQILEPGGGEDPIKGALTDAIKNCAKSFGVALELYGRTEEEAGGQSDTEDIPVNPNYQRTEAAPRQGGGGGTLKPPSERQVGLIRNLQRELGMSDAEVDALCKQKTGYGTEGMGGRTASGLIDALQELKQNGHRGSGGVNPTSASAPSSSPPSNGTAGTGATHDDVTVKRWVKTIDDARTAQQLAAMRATIQTAGLDDIPSIAEALARASTRVTGEAAGDRPF